MILENNYLIRDTFNFEDYVLKKELGKVNESEFKKSIK